MNATEQVQVGAGGAAAGDLPNPTYTAGGDSWFKSAALLKAGGATVGGIQNTRTTRGRYSPRRPDPLDVERFPILGEDGGGYEALILVRYSPLLAGRGFLAPTAYPNLMGLTIGQGAQTFNTAGSDGMVIITSY